MGKWDENSGYYCLLIAIFCGLDVYESVLMYKYGPNHPLCQKILRKKIKTEYREDMDSDEVGEMMYQLKTGIGFICIIRKMIWTRVLWERMSRN